MDSIDEVIAALATRQYALFARWQVRGLLDPRALKRRINRGILDELSASVLRVAGAPRSNEQRVMAATLDVPGGAAAWCFSAAWVWGLPGFSLRTVEVGTDRPTNGRSTLAVVHQPRLLLPEHVTRWKGMAVTTVARTIYDLSGRIHPARTMRLIASVGSRSPAVHTQLHDMLPVMAESGRNGITVMRAALERWPRGCALPGSGNEVRFEDVMARYGITGLRRQVDVGGHSWIGRVDYLCEHTNVIFEVDSELHHTSPVDVAEDEKRDAAARDAGFTDVVRIWTEVLWARPAEAASIVRQTRAKYRAAAS